jgi:salicylate hydroxylase
MPDLAFPTLRRYQHLDDIHDKTQRLLAEATDFDVILQAKIDTFLYGDKDFIYQNDIKKVWEDYLAAEQTGL